MPSGARSEGFCPCRASRSRIFSQFVGECLSLVSVFRTHRAARTRLLLPRPPGPRLLGCLPSSSYFSGKGGGRFGGGTHCPSWVKRVPPANPHTLRVTLSGGRGLSRWSICRGPSPLRAIIGHPRTAQHQGLHDSPWSRPSLAETLTSVQSRGNPTRGLGGFHETMAKKSIVYPAVSEGTAPQMRLRPRLIIIMTMTMTDQNINPLTPHTF